jgi:hypothetical protein
MLLPKEQIKMDPNQNINNTPNNTPIVPQQPVVSQPYPAQAPADLSQPQPLQQPIQAAQPATAQPIVQPSVMQPQPYNAAPVAAGPVSAPAAMPFNHNPQAQQNGGIVIGGGDMNGPQAQTFAPPVGNPFIKKKHLVSPLIGIIGAVFILGGASAATYFGYVLPNNPKNVLKTAVVNTLTSQQSEFNGAVKVAASSATDNTAANLSVNGSSAGKSFDWNVNVDVSGVSLPAELRYTGDSLYFKFGDLNPLVTYASAFSPSLSTPAQQIATILSNKWIAIDSTMLDEGGFNCLINQENSMKTADIAMLQSIYLKNPFISIVSSSSGTYNGKSVDVYKLSVNDDTGASFLNSFVKTSSASKIQSCLKSSGTAFGTTKGDGKFHNITVSVYKSQKKLAQISSNLTSSGKSIGTASIGFTYNPASISAPAGAVPFDQVAVQIESALSSDNLDLSGLGLNNLTSGGTINVKITKPGEVLVKSTKYVAAKTSAPITTNIPIKIEGLKSFNL